MCALVRPPVSWRCVRSCAEDTFGRMATTGGMAIATFGLAADQCVHLMHAPHGHQDGGSDSTVGTTTSRGTGFAGNLKDAKQYALKTDCTARTTEDHGKDPNDSEVTQGFCRVLRLFPCPLC
jgi:hypothetical protein